MPTLKCIKLLLFPKILDVVWWGRYPGELFDFDYEVEPILEVLVGKILEQSMMEIMEEDELANLQLHQVLNYCLE